MTWLLAVILQASTDAYKMMIINAGCRQITERLVLAIILVPFV